MAVTPRIKIEDVDGVRVIRLLEKLVFDDRIVRETAEQLQAALPNDGTPIRAVIDFTGVEMVSSSLLGKLVLVQRRVDTSGGGLRLCELTSQVQSVFRTSNLDRLFGIDRDRVEALDNV